MPPQRLLAGDGGAPATNRPRRRRHRENAERRAFRARAGSLQDFIDGLELVVSVGPASEADLLQISRLTHRTNRFNFSSRRRSAGEIRDFLARPRAHCLVVRVADRFGDYGLVGAVLYERLADRYRVDTFLLCRRALGRGVEHAVLHEVGRRALADGVGQVELAYRPTERNLAARAFLQAMRPGGETLEAATLEFSATELSRLSYEPGV